MNNKKGFTLIELSISIALLSVIMIFMLKLITIIREEEDSINIKTTMLLNKTIISKALHEDIEASLGIKTLSCDSSSTCTISFNNGKTKTLELNNEKNKITYKNNTDNKIEFTKKLPENYNFNLNKIENDYLYTLEINIVSHPEYNIEINYKKS